MDTLEALEIAKALERAARHIRKKINIANKEQEDQLRLNELRRKAAEGKVKRKQRLSLPIPKIRIHSGRFCIGEFRVVSPDSDEAFTIKSYGQHKWHVRNRIIEKLNSEFLFLELRVSSVLYVYKI